MADNNQTHTIEINYKARRAVNIGDVFYRVEPDEFAVFREPCKVCGGTGKLTVNGVTFRCPCCGSEKEIARIYHYLVRRYRVYKVIQDTFTTDWKASKYRDVTFGAYRKRGRGYDPIGGTGQFEFYPHSLDALNLPFDRETFKNLDVKTILYDDYTLAVHVAEQMNALELEHLAAYNKEYGTAHEANFKETHDPKSV